MNRLCNSKRAQILHLLCEGNSIRAVTRLTGASKTTVTKLVWTLAKPPPGTRIARYATSNASACRLMKSGVSSAQSKRTRTLQRRKPVRLATFGFGLRPMLRRSLFRTGASELATSRLLLVHSRPCRADRRSLSANDRCLRALSGGR